MILSFKENLRTMVRKCPKRTHWGKKFTRSLAPLHSTALRSAPLRSAALRSARGHVREWESGDVRTRAACINFRQIQTLLSWSKINEQWHLVRRDIRPLMICEKMMVKKALCFAWFWLIMYIPLFLSNLKNNEWSGILRKSAFYRDQPHISVSTRLEMKARRTDSYLKRK